MSKKHILDEIIEELTTEGLTNGYDTSILTKLDAEVLYLFYHFGRFRCWDALFQDIDPALLIDEDLLKPIFKTDSVSRTKIRIIKECIVKGLSTEPLLCADYDEASAYTIFCGLASGIAPEALMDNDRKLSKAELSNIIKARVKENKIIT